MKKILSVNQRGSIDISDLSGDDLLKLLHRHSEDLYTGIIMNAKYKEAFSPFVIALDHGWDSVVDTMWQNVSDLPNEDPIKQAAATMLVLYDPKFPNAYNKYCDNRLRSCPINQEAVSAAVLYDNALWAKFFFTKTSKGIDELATLKRLDKHYQQEDKSGFKDLLTQVMQGRPSRGLVLAVMISYVLFSEQGGELWRDCMCDGSIDISRNGKGGDKPLREIKVNMGSLKELDDELKVMCGILGIDGAMFYKDMVQKRNDHFAGG